MCDGLKHNLEEVYRRSGAASDAVVRWCGVCGAVVVDEDYDGQTIPGNYMRMRFPSMTFPNRRNQ